MGGMYLPLAAMLFKFGAAPVSTEKRILAQRPPLTWSIGGFQRYPRLFERYFNDNFGLRGLFVHAYMQCVVRGLHMARVNNVVIGRDGWLYFAGNDELEDYQRTRQFTPQQLERILSTQLARQRCLAERGISYYLMLAPNKSTVYPENMPRNLQRLPGPSRMTQLSRYLAANSSIPIVNVEELLCTARQDRLTYLLTDTHWNEYGAFLAHQTLMRRIACDMTNIAVLPLEACTVREKARDGADLAFMLGLHDLYRDTNVTVTPLVPFPVTNAPIPYAAPRDYVPSATHCRTPGLPRALIFRDSFGNRLLPFLAPYFARCVSVWTYDFDLALIETEQPDVVICELVERVLDVLDTTNTFVRSTLKPVHSP